MKITDEMMKVAQSAFAATVSKQSMESGYSMVWPSDWSETMLKDAWKDALKAVAPMIRKQAMEEAAKIVESQQRSGRSQVPNVPWIGWTVDQYNKYIRGQDDMKRKAADAIRAAGGE